METVSNYLETLARETGKPEAEVISLAFQASQSCFQNLLFSLRFIVACYPQTG